MNASDYIDKRFIKGYEFNFVMYKNRVYVEYCDLLKSNGYKTNKFSGQTKDKIRNVANNVVIKDGNKERFFIEQRSVKDVCANYLNNLDVRVVFPKKLSKNIPDDFVVSFKDGVVLEQQILPLCDIKAKEIKHGMVEVDFIRYARYNGKVYVCLRDLVNDIVGRNPTSNEREFAMKLDCVRLVYKNILLIAEKTVQKFVGEYLPDDLSAKFFVPDSMFTMFNDTLQKQDIAWANRFGFERSSSAPAPIKPEPKAVVKPQTDVKKTILKLKVDYVLTGLRAIKQDDKNYIVARDIFEFFRSDKINDVFERRYAALKKNCRCNVFIVRDDIEFSEDYVTSAFLCVLEEDARKFINDYFGQNVEFTSLCYFEPQKVSCAEEEKE